MSEIFPFFLLFLLSLAFLADALGRVMYRVSYMVVPFCSFFIFSEVGS